MRTRLFAVGLALALGLLGPACAGEDDDGEEEEDFGHRYRGVHAAAAL